MAYYDEFQQLMLKLDHRGEQVSYDIVRFKVGLNKDISTRMTLHKLDTTDGIFQAALEVERELKEGLSMVVQTKSTKAAPKQSTKYEGGHVFKPWKQPRARLDFHLVQFFSACLPSLAVYLVAQYARYEIRRMEAEAELKKKADEDAKAKELELMAEQEKQEATDPQLSEVKARLDKLEETLKEIMVETKKQSDNVADRPIDKASKKEPATTKPGSLNTQDKANPSSEGKTQAKSSLPDQKQIKSDGSSPDVNK
ncbi:hypothetical protein FXO37_11058 [Capsicum annuum]|nr:hypothetical protein FXO37_11058 [Capsicum annuum]